MTPLERTDHALRVAKRAERYLAHSRAATERANRLAQDPGRLADAIAAAERGATWARAARLYVEQEAANAGL